MRLVLVEWEDSSHGQGWRDLDAVVQSSRTVTCRSVGWLAKESEEELVLVPHMGNYPVEGGQQCCGDMTIPRAVVTSMVDLIDVEKARVREAVRSAG